MKPLESSSKMARPSPEAGYSHIASGVGLERLDGQDISFERHDRLRQPDFREELSRQETG